MITDEARKARSEYYKKYRERNREKLKEYQRQWNRKNADKIREYHAGYWNRKAEGGTRQYGPFPPGEPGQVKCNPDTLKTGDKV